MDLEKEALVGMAGLIAENFIEATGKGWRVTSSGEKAALKVLDRLTRQEQQLLLLYAALVIKRRGGG